MTLPALHPILWLLRRLAPAVACCAMLSGLGGCVDVAIFHRSVPDLIYSGITGRDCSVVRLDQGDSYCVPIALPPKPPPYCTRSLGRINCWARPELVVNLPPQVAAGPHDGSQALTEEQDRTRLARWPADLQ
nr:hypothetical protein [uncultured Lichenicoccus sp.]